MRYKGPRPLTIIFTLLALLALFHFIAVTHSAYPSIHLDTCSALIRYTDYTKLVHIQPQQEMEAVQYVDELTGGKPAVLVQVVDSSPQHLLDVYIYGCSMQRTQVKNAQAQMKPVITLLFKRQGLIQGETSITRANTLSISQEDTSISPDTSILLQPLEQNVYQEYTWRNGAFTQITFPGLYPALSRTEAEALQDQENNGQALPWNDPQVTAEQMAKDALAWPVNDLHSTVQDNDGTVAHLLLSRQSPHLEVSVTLKRLIQHNKMGLWFVTAAQTPDIVLNQTGSTLSISSPATLQGRSTLTDGQANVTLFDHALTPLKILNDAQSTIQANGTFTETLHYTNNIPGQPGLLLIEGVPASGSTDEGELLLMGTILG
jgi:hypothetical protein